MSFRFVDIFAGVGWFHIALHQLGGKLVSAIERDENARKTYQLNFFDKNQDVFLSGKFFENVTTTNEELLPDHDILCAGFPCQAFSIAGYRKWFKDERGNVFFDLHRIIKRKKPSVIFLENVKNLLTHDNGETYQIIKESLEALWYYIHAKVLNTSEYGGVPQNRERIYIVGFLDKGSYGRFRFPETIPLSFGIRDMLDSGVDRSFYYNEKPLYEKIKDHVIDKNKAYQWRRQYVRENKSSLFPTLTANMGTWGHNVPLVLEDDGIRKLTPRECFRIQGFPEDYQLPDMALSHLYKQSGNAVTVSTVKRVWEEIMSVMWRK